MAPGKVRLDRELYDPIRQTEGENMDDRPSLTGWITASGIAVAVLAILWVVYWALAGSAAKHENEINQNSNQNQSGLISQERDRVVGYNAATDDSQKALIKSQFCTIYPAITIVPTDLVQAHAQLCP